MGGENIRNEELLIVGQAFFNTGICKIEEIIQKYIDTAIYYNDSCTASILNNLKQDISRVNERNNQEENEFLQEKEENVFGYSGEIRKIYDKTANVGFCIKKDYINNKLVDLQGIYLDFNKSQIADLNKQECKDIEQLYLRSDNPKYQIVTKEFNNREYGKIIYDNIKNNFLVLKKDEVLER